MTVPRRATAGSHRMNGVEREATRRLVVYPTSDGKPMAETDVHRQEMTRLIDTLDALFAADPAMYVSGNLLLHYEEGDPRASVAPDVFVVRGVAKGLREVYKLWEEQRPPVLIIEVTSRTTRREDLGKKQELYARLGVREYILYDPLGEYLRPPLQGYRLGAGAYRAMEPDAEYGLLSELGLRLRLMDGRLMLFDRQTGARLLSPAERVAAEAARADAEAARADAEAARADAEATARRTAEQRIAELEAMLQRDAS
jgi:Uma2 family endonuclease